MYALHSDTKDYNVSWISNSNWMDTPLVLPKLYIPNGSYGWRNKKKHVNIETKIGFKQINKYPFFHWFTCTKYGLLFGSSGLSCKKNSEKENIDLPHFQNQVNDW